MILPIFKETLELPLNSSKLTEIVRISVKRGKSKSHQQSNLPFMGKINGETFELLRITEKELHHKTQVNGEVVEKEAGSTVYLKYTLNFSSIMFLIYWGLNLISFGTFLWFMKSEWVPVVIALTVLLLNLFFTHYSFRKELKVTRKLLLQIFES